MGLIKVLLSDTLSMDLFMEHDIIIPHKTFSVYRYVYAIKYVSPKVNYINSSCKLRLLTKRLVQRESPCFGL